MLKKFTLVGLGVTVFLLAGGQTLLRAQAGLNPIVSDECDPTSCTSEQLGVIDGIAAVDIYGECFAGNTPSASAGVEAINCSAPANLYAAAIAANQEDVMGYVDLGLVDASADGVAASGAQWSMYELQYCNYTSEYDASPPVPC